MGFYDIPFVTAIKDVTNFFKFKKDIKREELIMDSPYNRFNFKHNWLGNIVYFQINCTEEELQRFDYHPENMVLYKIKPMVDYITNLGWSEYIIPEINNFTDANGKMSLSYGILFIYTPIKFSTGWLVKTLFKLGLLATAIWAGIKYIPLLF